MQKPGICKDHFHWMATEAQKECVSVAGRHGYVMFDEMAIQVTKNMSNSRTKQIAWQICEEKSYTKNLTLTL